MLNLLWQATLLTANVWATGSFDGLINAERRTEDIVEPPPGRYSTPELPKQAFSPLQDPGKDDDADVQGSHTWVAKQLAKFNANAKYKKSPQYIVDLSKRGASDKSIIMWINWSGVAYNLTADDVKSLRDQKVSAAVIDAMLAHSATPTDKNENEPRNPILPAPHELIGKRVLLETRSEYGPPILSDIPYLSRLFRTVGWSRTSVAIQPPIQHGEKSDCVHPPTEAEILQALPAGCRDNVAIVVEKLVDKIDPPRFFPLIGPAQLHHVHWKCVVHFDETDLPGPKNRRSEVVYIDTDHLHLVATEQAAAPASQPEHCPYCPGGHTGPAKGATPGDPSTRMEQMLIDTDNLRQMHDEWRRFFATEEERARRVAPADLLVINGIQVGSKKAITAAECSIICGDHLIRPDGTISLGTFGSANVAGLTLDQVKSVIEDHLKPYFAEPRVAVALKTERGPIVPVGATEESAAPPRSPQVAQALPQVQLEILVAEVPSNAFRDAGLRWSEARTGLIDNGARFGVTEKPNALLCSLQVMFANGTAKQVAQPRLTTLSGQWAYFASGGKTPVTTSDGVTSTPFDTVVQFRPIVQGDGRIHLDIQHEASPKESSLEHTNSASADVKDGHTLVFVLHGAGSGSDKEKQDFVILVTPHVVHPVSSSETTPSKQMTFADIVRLSKRGIGEDIIIRQMELTESVFTLTVEDILSLNEQGVSDNLIRAMQNRVQSR